MSKLTDSFRDLDIHEQSDGTFRGIYNAYGFHEEKGRVFISYSPEVPGRGYRPAHWSVVMVGGKTDPDGHFMNYGNKVFGVFSEEGDTLKERRANALAKAQEWASEKYGITEWAKDPYGSYGEASFVKARVKKLKALVKEQSQ